MSVTSLQASQNESVAELPLVVDLVRAAELLGIGRTLAYQLVRTGEWPTPVIRVGRLIRVPSVPLLEFLRSGSAVTPTHEIQPQMLS